MVETDYRHDYFLTAAQCNAQKELPAGTLVQQIIDVATEDANRIGVGASRLGEEGNTWVLSRLAIDMDRYPAMEEHYSISTWVESFARFFSERNFEIRGGMGEIIGRARTTWVCINRSTRRPADISDLAATVDIMPDRKCPVDPAGRLRPVVNPQIENEYTFHVSDIDFNRHVNSVRYADLFVNQSSLSTYDDFYISRFEIVFHHEAHFGDHVTVASRFDGDAILSQIGNPETLFCLSRIFMARRPEYVPGFREAISGTSEEGVTPYKLSCTPPPEGVSKDF